MKEIWKDIEGYEGLYIVSSLGRIKNLRSGLIKKTPPNMFGYLHCNLSKNKIVKDIRIHRVVAKTFIPNPQNKPCIDHINNDKTDNRVVNLRWCTYTENLEHTPHRKRTVNQFDTNGKLLNTFISVSLASRELGFTQQCISACCNGYINKYKGFIWEYVI